jgi:hypothetical protein
MLYSILIYGSEARVAAWTADEEEEVLGRHAALRETLLAQGRLGPVLRLAPPPVVTDGPYAETKEQLMGIYIVECATPEEANEAAHRLDFETGRFEIRPLVWFDPGVVPARRP